MTNRRAVLKAPALIVAVAILTIAATALSAAERGSLPPSALPGVLDLETIERHEMPWVDVEALLAEDAAREGAEMPVAPRFATNIEVAYTPANSGTWETFDNGSRLWRLRISSPEALSLSLGMERFDLPEGAAFWVHAPDGSWVQGPYTRKSRNALGGLWTAVVLGDEIVAELYLPVGKTADIEINSVNHDYRGFGRQSTNEPALKRGSCNVNVVCPVGNRYSDHIRSVARITFASGSDSHVCTAQLINNTAEDETPYLYSAGHCVETDTEAASLVAYWNYQTATCEDRFGGSLNQNQSGATLVAHSPLTLSNQGFDFSLMELDTPPDASFDVYFAGWDARDRIPSATTTIHHPFGDQKSISFDDDPPTVTSWLGSSSPGNGTHFRIADWDLGTTEGGSSGACLWDQDSGLCVGDLSGGYAACGNNDPDWFARFHLQWTGGGTPETRLSDWLDPVSTGVDYLFGMQPGSVSTASAWLIPAVASTPGAEGSNWKSQVSVANSSTSSRNALVYFVPDGEEWPGEEFGGPYLIGPMGSLYLDDPLQSQSPTAGLMYITVDGGDTVAFSRTINLTDGGATFGQGMPGVLLNDASLVTEYVLPMVHSAAGRYRTNLGFAQTSGGKYSVLVSIYSADSILLAERKYAIDTAWRQVDDIFAKMGIGDQDVEGGWIRVNLAGGSPAFWTTYATVIDDATNDSTYVLPVAP